MAVDNKTASGTAAIKTAEFADAAYYRVS